MSKALLAELHILKPGGCLSVSLPHHILLLEAVIGRCCWCWTVIGRCNEWPVCHPQLLAGREHHRCWVSSLSWSQGSIFCLGHSALVLDNDFIYLLIAYFSKILTPPDDWSGLVVPQGQTQLLCHQDAGGVVNADMVDVNLIHDTFMTHSWHGGYKPGDPVPGSSSRHSPSLCREWEVWHPESHQDIADNSPWFHHSTRVWWRNDDDVTFYYLV